uniref:Uncharacterized protein ypbD n=1 Tax=Anthurium amnicola TaxID=1678845 RepID=A0A1D1XHF2_9ARAE
MMVVSVVREDAIICLSRNSVVSIAGWKYKTISTLRFVSPEKLHTRIGAKFKSFASRSTRKKLSKEWKTSKFGNSQSIDVNCKDQEEFADDLLQEDACRNDSGSDLSKVPVDAKGPISSPSRTEVLQACILTSGLVLTLGAFIRQVSHVAFTEGWVNFDSTEVSFHFEMWHLELIGGLVILISLCRYILLNAWPDFAESSERANQQVLSSLEPIDYLVVACLPGISEELLFRGGLLPLFGLNWMSAMVVAAIFGCLHLGGGRRYSFAIWATFVGFAYGMATIISSSIIIPMASHSLNNLIGGILWRYGSTLREKADS